MASTFICYRGSGVDGGIGIHIAEQLYNIIKDDPYFGEVFFSPKWEDNDFIGDACEFISNVDNFFVILSPSFFQGFEENGKVNTESVTYHELKTAFQNEHCIFRPIRVYGFDWNNNGNLEQLKRLYPDSKVSRLYQRTGLVLKGDQIADQDIQRFRKNNDTTGAVPLKKEEILQDLDDCVNTIFDAKIPLDPNSMLSDIFEYLHMNPQRKLLFPNAFRQEFDRVSKECELSSDQFCYWPIDLLSCDQDQQPNISICAICFGTLMLHHWLTIDQLNSTPVEPESIQEIKEAINGAINLLVALRSPVSGSWPASWHFDSIGVDGTINQTTLSLSTLLTCNFLSNDLDGDVFKRRYFYISKSVDWLLSSSNTTRQHFQVLRGWGHMRENSDVATLPTAFAMDTLLKFYSCLTSWISAFPEDKAFCEELSKKHRELQTVICQGVRYFHYAFLENGIGFGIARGNERISIPHTAKVMKTLIRFLRTTKDSDVPEEIVAAAKDIVEKVRPFLATRSAEQLFGMSGNELFEFFSYTNHTAAISAEAPANFYPNSGETFEMCSELIYLDAFISYDLYVRDCSSEELLHIADVFRKYREWYVATANGRFVVGGHKPDFPKCPIYAMYYYRMVLDDLFLLGEKYGQ